ncbi:MAG: hypothetical protein WD960_11715 [Gemmatimonadota bacterium]
MDTASPVVPTLAEFLTWCQAAPPGTALDAAEVARCLTAIAEEEGQGGEGGPQEEEREGSPPWTWRERLWLVPAETRIGVAEVAEALGRPKSFVYGRTGRAIEGEPIPHRKLDGTLVFTAGELRAWIRDREEVVVGGRMESTEAERAGRLHVV